MTGRNLGEVEHLVLFPATHFMTNEEHMEEAIKNIMEEMEAQVKQFEAEGKLIEAQRIRQRTEYDVEMLREMGYTNGVENYSRHMDGRKEGEPPFTLLDFFPEDFLIIIDESHMTMGQIKGMYNGDQARKKMLVDYGFRLPSALDNRPLRREEFESHVHQIVYVSATPGDYEMEQTETVVEQIIRPTGLLDPEVEVRPTMGQMDDLLGEINARTEKGERVFVTTLTKKMAEDLTDYLKEMGVKVKYMHSDIKTLERTEIIRDLRLGVFDVLIGINLLREGIDVPEVSLVAILDASFVMNVDLSKRLDVLPEIAKGTLSCMRIRLQSLCKKPWMKQLVVVKSRWPIIRSMALFHKRLRKKFVTLFLLPRLMKQKWQRILWITVP